MHRASSQFFPPPISSPFSSLARFKNSRFDNELDLAAFTENFDASVKKIFWDSSHSYYVKFCSPRDNDARCGIKCGKLILPG